MYRAPATCSWLGGHLVFARVLSRVGTGIIVRQRYRGEVARHVSNVAVGSGAWIFGTGMVFVVFTMSSSRAPRWPPGYKGLEQIGARRSPVRGQLRQH
jgi:hypothetical protein